MSMHDDMAGIPSEKSHFWQLLETHMEWALPTPDARQTKRRASSPNELKSFYDAALPHLADMLAECDRFPLGQLPERQRDLLNLALCVAEVAPHVELYKLSPKVPNSFEESQLIASHGRGEVWRPFGYRPAP